MKSFNVLAENILTVLCKSLSHPYDDIKIRASIVECDYENNLRRNVCSYDDGIDSENWTLPIDFGVVGECITQRATIYRELADDHIEKYDEEIRHKISPSLKAIIAAPILNLKNYRISHVLAIEILNVNNLKIDMSRYNFNDPKLLKAINNLAGSLWNLSF